MSKKKEEKTINNEKNDDDDDKFINVDTSNIYYCPQCNSYNIYIKGYVENKDTHSYSRCNNCNNKFTQNIYVDEAKVYFNSEECIKKRKFIGRDCSTIKIRNYSRKVITNMDS